MMSTQRDLPGILLRVTLAGIAVMAAGWIAARLQPLPSHWDAGEAAAPDPTVMHIVDRDGQPLAVMRGVEHPFIPVALDQIDPLLIEATLSAEDQRFFLHPGIDPAAVLRASLQNLRSGSLVSGGSTLTQQLVTLMDEQAPTVLREPAEASPGDGARAAGRGASEKDSRTTRWWRKLRTAWLALALETRWSKEQILEAYFNRASYGTDLRGVRSACRAYFGHDPDIVTLEEAALLAALPQSPVRLDPRRRPDEARAARNRVLQRMSIDQEVREQARARSPGLTPAWSPPGASIAPHWIARLANLPSGICEVRLPLDRALQIEASEALRDVVHDLVEMGADAGGVTAIHNNSGEVRAWVGSPDWRHPEHGQVDGTLALRQPGSALKPFAYALAFERDLRPSSILPDLPASHPGADGVFRPRNYSGAHRGPVRARMALANSWNAPAVALLAELGAGEFLAVLHDLGIESLHRPADDYGLGLILGVGEVTLAELTNAYACLARGGIHHPRVEILEARDAAGNLVSGPAGAPAFMRHRDSREELHHRRVFGTDACFFTASVLSDEEARAPEFGCGDLLSFPYPAAIKTGTSSDWRDNWAFGFTEEWTVGVWVGAAGGEPMDQVSGTAGALRVLRRVLDHLHPAPAVEVARADDADTAPGRFPAPHGLERRRVCALSGMRPGAQCADQVPEWFHAGDPEGAVCDWHTVVRIDAATGLRARPCTPTHRVREVRFVRSGSAGAFGRPSGNYASWMEDQGWPSPPIDATPCICMQDGCRPAQDGLYTQVSDAGRPRDVVAAFATGPPADPPAPDDPRAFCRIRNPVDGSIYVIDATLPAAQQAIALEGSGAGEELIWYMNGEEYARAAPGERVFWRLQPGRHEVVLRSSGSGDPEPGDAVWIVVEDDE